MAPAGLAAVERAKTNGSWTMLDDVESLAVPEDLAAALDAQPHAADHWAAFPPSSQRMILEWIRQAKRPATRAARIAEDRRAGGTQRARQPLAPEGVRLHGCAAGSERLSADPAISRRRPAGRLAGRPSRSRKDEPGSIWQ